MVAILLALTAAFGFACVGIFARLGSQGISARAGAAISIVPSFVVATIPALILHMPAYFEIPLVGILWIFLLAIINYPLARLFNFTSVSKIGIARATPLFNSSPLFSLVLAITFLGERPNAPIILGTLAIVAGVILVLSERQSSDGTSKDH